MAEFEKRTNSTQRQVVSQLQRPSQPSVSSIQRRSQSAPNSARPAVKPLPAAFQLTPASAMTSVTAQRRAAGAVLEAATLSRADQVATQQIQQRLAVQRETLRDSHTALQLGGLTPQPEHLLERSRPRPEAPVPDLTPIQRQALSQTASNTVSSALSANARFLPPTQRAEVANAAVQRFKAQGLDPEPLRALMVQRAPDEATRAAAQVAITAQRQVEQRQHQERADHALLTRHAALQRQLQAAEQHHAAEQTSAVERIEARRGSGQPLAHDVRRRLEVGLNHDLTGVRVHTDSEAHLIAKQMQAVAFTSGKDIYFQSGTFDPVNKLELLAHEATHVKQQDSGHVGRGIDPDAGLEAQAQEMGKRVASQSPGRAAFGTAAPRNKHAPGSLTAVQASAQRGTAVQAVQRLSNPFSSLANMAKKSTQALSDTAKRASGAARRVLQSVGKKVQAAAKPLASTISKARTSLAAQVAKVSASLRQKAASLIVKSKRLAAPLTSKINKAIKGARASAARVKASLQRCGANFVSAARANFSGLKREVSKVTAQVKRRGQPAWQAGTQAVRGAVSSVKEGGQALLQKASNTAQSMLSALRQKTVELKAAAQRKLASGLDTVNKLKQKAVSAAVSLKAKLKSTGQHIAAGASAGWSNALKFGKTTLSAVGQKISAIAHSPKTQSILAKLKSAGIQVAKVGTAIVVGGAVIAGAAALTVATGGLAGPALVAALFASGALGGAASQVVGNALEGKKLTDGISAGTILTDGLMGVAAGPAAKLVGGVARAVIIKPVAGLAGHVMSGVGGRVAQGAGRLLTRYAPSVRPLVAGAASAARTRLVSLAGRVVGIPARLAATRGGRLAASAVSGTRSLITRGSNWLGHSLPGRGLKAADNFVSGGLRRVAGVPGRVGAALGRGLNRAGTAVRSFIKSKPGLNRLSGAARNGVERLRDRIGVAGIRARNAVTGPVRAAYSGLKGNAVRAELNLRRRFATSGLNINLNTSLTGRVIDAAERSLSSMKTYITAEARTISVEVREAFYGSGGIGGALRTGSKIEDLIAANPALRGAWNKELNYATRTMTDQIARTMRREASAVGQSLSRTVSRNTAASTITQDAVREFALRNMRGSFMTKATNIYRSSLPSVTDFNPQKGWLGQVPGLYARGMGQMARGAANKLRQIRYAGGMAGGAATAGGWLSEEYFKTFSGGVAGYYHTDPSKRSGSPLAAGLGGTRSLTPAITGLTGLSPEAQGGPNMILTPLDQQAKIYAEKTGVANQTDLHELGHEEDKKHPISP
ncbi:DUF4157 domain-containing protein [Deinococcus psychrotolerans]|uniref:DUF4157 domain-containing protein n=1 Tax=Deinococcus psychrotolerans TaxID=2489213 RepID=A0A3G8YDD5_9DEIO|nr:DUF4157 domain-containing protein [Deinococcus psychrotolerans]AZI42870.1 DUF4157 domain-containing protein [Deinococcus psychrotolerans]